MGKWEREEGYSYTSNEGATVDVIHWTRTAGSDEASVYIHIEERVASDGFTGCDWSVWLDLTGLEGGDAGTHEVASGDATTRAGAIRQSMAAAKRIAATLAAISGGLK